MGIEDKLPADGFITTTIEGVIGWMRQASFWPATLGLASCAIDQIAYGVSRYDADRWGQIVFRASPRQADLMIVSGRVSHKMAPIVRQVYDQMPNPKWVIAMGACASSGGVFNNYAIVQGVDHIVPVDIYVPGCPPRPDQLIDAVFKLKKGQGLELAPDDPARAHVPVSKYPTGQRRARLEAEIEAEQLAAPATIELKGLMR
jgi:NADH-quinone oxidoreductase subunit B